MAGSINTVTAPDGAKRYRDASGRQHEKRCRRTVDAQQWLDEQTSALVAQTGCAASTSRAGA